LTYEELKTVTHAEGDPSSDRHGGHGRDGVAGEGAAHQRTGVLCVHDRPFDGRALLFSVAAKVPGEPEAVVRKVIFKATK